MKKTVCDLCEVFLPNESKTFTIGSIGYDLCETCKVGLYCYLRSKGLRKEDAPVWYADLIAARKAP